MSSRITGLGRQATIEDAAHACRVRELQNGPSTPIMEIEGHAPKTTRHLLHLKHHCDRNYAQPSLTHTDCRFLLKLGVNTELPPTSSPRLLLQPIIQRSHQQPHICPNLQILHAHLTMASNEIHTPTSAASHHCMPSRKVFHQPHPINRLSLHLLLRVTFSSHHTSRSTNSPMISLIANSWPANKVSSISKSATHATEFSYTTTKESNLPDALTAYQKIQRDTIGNSSYTTCEWTAQQFTSNMVLLPL